MATQGVGTKTLSVNIPEALHDRLEEVCEERVVGKGLLVTKALEKFLDGLRPVSDGLEPTPEPEAADPAKADKRKVTDAPQA